MLEILPSQVRRGAIVILEGDHFGTPLLFPLTPTKLDFDGSANYEDQDIWGRSEPIQQYKNSSLRTLELIFPIEALTGAIYSPNVGVAPPKGAKTEGSLVASLDRTLGLGLIPKKVRDCVNFLEALRYPREGFENTEFTGGPGRGPPPFLFVWGDYISLRCKMRNVKTEMSQFDASLNPTRVQVRCSIAENSGVHTTFERRMKYGNLSPTTGRG